MWKDNNHQTEKVVKDTEKQITLMSLSYLHLNCRKGESDVTEFSQSGYSR